MCLQILIPLRHNGLENACKLLNEMLDLIKEKLEKGEDVLITGLGKFQLRDKKSRPGRDPKSKRDYVISARRVVTFHPSKVWRDELNNKI